MSPTKRNRSRQKEEVKELREHIPPASAGKDSYTLLKFYNLSTMLVSSVLKVSESEEYYYCCVTDIRRTSHAQSMQILPGAAETSCI